MCSSEIKTVFGLCSSHSQGEQTVISHDSSNLVVKDLVVQYGGPWFKCWSVTFYL